MFSALMKSHLTHLLFLKDLTALLISSAVKGSFNSQKYLN